MLRVIVAVAGLDTADRTSGALTSLGYEVALAGSESQLLDLARGLHAQIVITDHAFIAAAGPDLLADLRAGLPGTSLVILSPDPVERYPDRAGPGKESEPGVTTPDILHAIESVWEALRTRAAAAGSAPAEPAAPAAPRRPALDPFAGDSSAIRRLRDEALLAIGSESPILIEGETGTGKGVLAAWLHRHGPRAQEPFVALNCAGFTRELLDSELFGHVAQVSSGAGASRPGLLETADRGTVFLDEIGDMEASSQGKLLKFIEERRFWRVDDSRERTADVRIIAATRQHLLERARAGEFREDLYFRLGVLVLRVPALRARTTDIPTLARHIVAVLALGLGLPEPRITRGADAKLASHPWPGNLRELRNELERAILASAGGDIDARHLELDSARVPARVGEFEGGTLEEVERAYIERALREDPHVERAAHRLGIARSTFYQRLRSLGITLPE